MWTPQVPSLMASPPTIRLQAAKAAGMHSVAVTNSYDAEQLHLADKIVDKLSDLSMDDLRRLCA